MISTPSALFRSNALLPHTMAARLRFGSDANMPPKPPHMSPNKDDTNGDTFTTCQTEAYGHRCQGRCFECERGMRGFVLPKR